MLSNNGLCLHTAMQYMLLFIITVNNSAWFQIYVVTLTLAACSYALLTMLYTMFCYAI